MNVLLEAETVCERCGTKNLAMQCSNVRVNKNSLRTLSVSVGWASPNCKTCSAEIPYPPKRWRLTADDAAKVNAFRAKKGWEPV